MQIPPLPESETERELFLENERNLRPRDLLYRFYACGGFWLCEERHITHFLQSFKSWALGDMVPFLRVVLKVSTLHSISNEQLKLEHLVPPFNTNPRRRLMASPNPTYAIQIYNELFRALAWHGRDTEFLLLWHEAKACTF